MEVNYDDPRLIALMSDERVLRKAYGDLVVKRLANRMTSIRNTVSLADLHKQPGRTHALKGNRAGQFSMDLPGGLRLVLRPTPPVPTYGDGGINLSAVTAVTIIEISNHYA